MLPLIFYETVFFQFCRSIFLIGAFVFTGPTSDGLTDLQGM